MESKEPDFKKFREWAESKDYSDGTISSWINNLKSLLELGIDVEEATEERIRISFWGRSRVKRSLKLTALRRYQEFRNENGG